MNNISIQDLLSIINNSIEDIDLQLNTPLNFSNFVDEGVTVEDKIIIINQI